MSKKELLKRYALFILGLFINALGVSFITKANLGTSPISSIPYTFSLGFPYTMGEFTFLLNMVLIVGQMIFLKKDFKKIQFLQIPVSVLFGYFIDLTMSSLSFVNPEAYVLKIISLLIGCTILGFGVSIEVIADVVMLSGEAFVKAISTTLKKEFGITKICFDATLTLGACITSFVLFNNVSGVREGTVIAALIVGLIAKFFNKRLVFVNNLLSESVPAQVVSEETKEKEEQIIITIAREFGSGGHQVGEELAHKMGISFYDKELIDIVAKESGYPIAFVENHDQKITNSLLYDLVMQNYAYTKEDLPPLDALFVAQSKVIKNIADKESCVIVGRCADYILQDNPNCIHVFIHANKENRIKRLMDKYSIDFIKVEDEIKKNDKERSNYYRRYTNKPWENVGNYNMTIDTGIFGIDGAVNMIEEAIHQKKSMK